MNQAQNVNDHSAVATIDGAESRSLEAIVDELQSVIDDVQGFLKTFCERLEACLPDDLQEFVGPTLGEDHWETKRENVEKRIRQQVDMLTEAWLRLESEQRDLFQRQAGLEAGKTARSENRASPGNGHAAERTMPDESAASVPSLPLAVHEFERLRREIQSTRPTHHVKRD